MITSGTFRPLPFEPEPYAAIKHRFPAAIERLTTPAEQIQAFRGQSSLLTDRNHIYDFENGVRLIATKEQTTAWGTMLHLSFGIPPGVKTNVFSDDALKDFARQTASDLLGKEEEPFQTLRTPLALQLFYAV